MAPHERTTTIITPTYNKPDDLRETAKTVFGQISRDWVWWIILDGPTRQTRTAVYELAAQDDRIRVFEESTTEEDRRRAYRPASILNKYLPRVQTGRIAWLADDDLWHPEFLSKLSGALDNQPDWDIVFCGFGTYHVLHDGRLVHRYNFTDYRDRGYGTNRKCWGEVLSINTLFTRRAYRAILPFRIPDSWETARLCDHLLMRELESKFIVHGVPEIFVTNRVTARSANTISGELNSDEARHSGISLKPIDEFDLEFTRQLRNANRQAFLDDREVSAEEQQSWFARLRTDSQIAFYVVFEGTRRIGTVSLTARSETIELGNFLLIDECRGRGLMEYACRLLMKPQFRYRATVKRENIASRRLLERLGVPYTIVRRQTNLPPTDIGPTEHDIQSGADCETVPGGAR